MRRIQDAIVWTLTVLGLALPASAQRVAVGHEHGGEGGGAGGGAGGGGGAGAGSGGGTAVSDSDARDQNRELLSPEDKPPVSAFADPTCPDAIAWAAAN